MSGRGPWVERVVAAASGLVAERWRDEVLGDLVEEYRERAGRGRWTAGAWLIAHFLRAALASRIEARRAGGKGGARRDGRRRGGGESMSMLTQDLAFAVRGFRRAPVFSGVAVLTLALGIGATLAIGTVLNGVFLRPLPYPDADRLVQLRGPEGGRYGVAFPLIEEARRDGEAFDRVTAWQGWVAIARESDGTPSRRLGASVSADYLDLLGVPPAHGRYFTPEEGLPGHEPVVVLSHDWWVRDFGEDPDVVGRTVELSSVHHRIVGVAPPGFRDPVAASLGRSPEMWRSTPDTFERGAGDWGWVGFWAVGRLAPGVEARDATAELERLVRGAQPGIAPDDPLELEVVTLREAAVREVRPTLLVLLAAVVAVLLIGCANVANLLLSRATVRGREMAVRASLGASRSRLLRQLVTEGLVLSVTATAVGLVAAMAGADFLAGLAGAGLPDTADIVLDARVVAIAAALSLGTTVIFALVPALRFTGGDFMAGLRDRGGDGRDRRGRALRRGLVISETALAVVLLVAAGLLIRTFAELTSLDPGFDADRVATLVLGLPDERFSDPADQDAALDAAVAAVSGRIDGAVGAITDLPMSGAVNSTGVIPAGQEWAEATVRVSTLVRAVTPGYFQSMGVPVLLGRDIGADDVAAAEPVAVVNRTFARRFFEGGGAVGERVSVRGTDRRIVGVVEDVTEFALGDEPSAALYEPYAQNTQPWMRSSVWLTMRSGGDPAGAAAAVRPVLRDVDPRFTVGRVRTLTDIVAADVAAPRFRALLVGLFGGVALLLTALGIASVMAYAVTRRLPEMGLRLALGASRGEVTRLIVRESVQVAAVGAAIGVGAALAGGRLLSSFLFGVPPTDVTILGGVVALLAAVAVAAAWLPARRAARVDPVRTLAAD